MQVTEYDEDLNFEADSIDGYQENFNGEDLYDEQIQERETEETKHDEEELAAQAHARNLGVRRQEKHVRGQDEEQGYLNSENLFVKKEQDIANSCETHCELCHNLRSPRSSNIATRSTPISTQDYMRTYSAFEISSLNNLGIAFGLFMAGFSGHAVIPSLARDMVNPEEFDTMINWAFVSANAVLVIQSFIPTSSTSSSPPAFTP